MARAAVEHRARAWCSMLVVVLAAAASGCGGGSSATVATTVAPSSVGGFPTTTSGPTAPGPTVPSSVGPSSAVPSSAVPSGGATGATDPLTPVTTPPQPIGSGLTESGTPSGAYVVTIDPGILRVAVMPGAVEPSGSFIHPSAITGPARSSVVAAFNGGFKFKDSEGGFYLGGVTAKPLVVGGASLVVFTDGTATVGAWGRDVTMSSRVEAVLQNLHLMVDHGATTDVTDTDTHRWGSTFPKERHPNVPRSGVCVAAAGGMRWVGGLSLGAATLARAMVAAGCVRGMELDINPRWVSFSIFDHPDRAHPAVVTGHNLYAGQRFPAESYLAGKPRPWIMLTRR